MRHQGEHFDAGLSRGNVLGLRGSTFHQKSGECHDLQRKQIKINLLINLSEPFFDTTVGPRPNLARMCG